MTPIYSVQLVRQAEVNYAHDTIQVLSATSACKVAANILGKYFSTVPYEEVHVISLDSSNYPIGSHFVTRGILNSSLIRAKEIFQPLMLINASKGLLVHNHPSGETAPSRQDIDATTRIRYLGRELDLDIIDHIVLGVKRGLINATSVLAQKTNQYPL